MRTEPTGSFRRKFLTLRRLAAKRLFRLLGRSNTRLQPHAFFSIKEGYHHALEVNAFDDRSNTDEWQTEVYKWAAELAGQMHDPLVLDLGCGSGYKLLHMLGQFRTIGIELEPAYSWLKAKYPDRSWLLFDQTDPTGISADLVICSDVIEHMENPDDLLDFLEALSFGTLIISTPERDSVAGNNDYGPPANPAHYREWNETEFRNYLRERFVVRDHKIFNDKSVTQVVICEKKPPA